MTKPVFIVFEGIDGCGKTTQLHRLHKVLTGLGRKVQMTAEPTDLQTGKDLRALLAGKGQATAEEMAVRFTLDRVCHNTEPGGIGDLLRSGNDVLCDRYYYSSLAYQGALTDYDWVKHMNCNCPAIRHPDLCIFLDLSPEAALERIGKRGDAPEIYEKSESLSVFRKTFFNIFDSLPDHVAVIDASADVEKVGERVTAAVLSIL